MFPLGVLNSKKGFLPGFFLAQKKVMRNDLFSDLKTNAKVMFTTFLIITFSGCSWLNI